MTLLVKEKGYYKTETQIREESNRDKAFRKLLLSTLTIKEKEILNIIGYMFIRLNISCNLTSEAKMILYMREFMAKQQKEKK